MPVTELPSHESSLTGRRTTLSFQAASLVKSGRPLNPEEDQYVLPAPKMMPDSRPATAAPRSCTVWPLPLTSRLPLTAIENALVPELELELELAAVVLARVTVVESALHGVVMEVGRASCRERG